MTLSREIVAKLKNIEKESGSYLTIERYNLHRGELPTWSKLKKQYKLENFEALIAAAGLSSKQEYIKKENLIKAISNFKILNKEHGYITKEIYRNSGLTPSTSYIYEHYKNQDGENGFEYVARLAQVNLENRYYNEEQLLRSLKKTIKELGYIPSVKNYKELSLSPSVSTLSSNGLTWNEALKKAGYKINKTGKNQKVCTNSDCYNLIEFEDNELYCENCYRELRKLLIQNLDEMDIDTLRESMKKLIYRGNNEKTILELTRIKVY